MGNSRLLEFIPYGRDNSITLDELKTISGYSSKRRLCGAIEQLRRDGVPVLADGSGIFISTDLEDISNYISFMKSRAVSMLVTCRSLEQVADSLVPGQGKLFQNQNERG